MRRWPWPWPPGIIRPAPLSPVLETGPIGPIGPRDGLELPGDATGCRVVGRFSMRGGATGPATGPVESRQQPFSRRLNGKGAVMNRLNGVDCDQGSGTGRNGHGQFAAGNPGGPGRPRRVTECDYLRTLTEECPPEMWRAICRRAVADALVGDGKARDWLSKFLLGNLAELPMLGAATTQPEGPNHDDRCR